LADATHPARRYHLSASLARNVDLARCIQER